MKRSVHLKKVNSKKKPWDVLIIGGGASGLGAAVDAASRGYRTLLLEKNDFAKGTSSRSTKLVHGGVRYLQNGDISLVIEALKERGIMRKNAPHLVQDLSFVIPSYDWWNSPFYGIGLKIYDMMAGNLGLGPSTLLDREETIELIPNVKKKGLRGGVIYHDGQFDDARMAVSLAQTAENHGASLLNYFGVIGLLKEGDMVTFTSTGIEITGADTGRITGDLTMNGITKSITLDARLNQLGTNPMTGQNWAGFDATTTLLRSDFDMGAFAPLISDDVQVHISIEAGQDD